MSKTLKYSSFVIACMLVIVAFVTAKSYTQLGAAVILYPLTVFFAYKLFISNNHKETTIHFRLPQKLTKANIKTIKPKREQVEVADVDKRTFIKFIGAAGVSFFLFSLLGRRVESLLFGRNIDPAITGFGNPNESVAGAAQLQPTEGYLISEIDDSFVAYYGFTNKGGAWFIMKENPDEGSFRYTKGDTDFSGNWENRENLKYDYYHKVFF